MPQFSEQHVKVGRIVSRVATAMLDGISLSALKWKSGRTTAGAARSALAAATRRACSATGSAGDAALSKTRISSTAALSNASAGIVVAFTLPPVRSRADRRDKRRVRDPV